jgi:hypothetical protein
MCKNVDGSTKDCNFKIHELKCPKGHPLHISVGKTFLCCRSGCKYVEFVNAENIGTIQAQFNSQLSKEKEEKVND